ncbi:MAG: twin-arginine translocase subunit TatC [Xanthomonadales bacterium]|nr:twin-arginine translocase subunit TatC [Xanthomonadales bacterium]
MTEPVKDPQSPAEEAVEMTFVGHLVELRSRLLKASLAVLVVLVVLLPFSGELYTILSAPLLAHQPEGSQMVAIDVASPFLAPFKLTLMLALLISIPVIIYQLWAFVAPGLYQKEKHITRPLLFSACILFYAGCAFAYFVVFPLMFGFFARVAPEGVSVMTDISRYLDFVLTLFLAFGLVFEVPVATIILVALRVTTPDKLAAKRGYVIVGAFALGMLLTPPDIISQTLLAIPMWLLFEVGIILSRILIRQPEETKDSTVAS